MKIRSKMLIFSAFLAVIPVLFTAQLAHKIASTQIQQALIEKGKNHLIFIRDAKKAEIEEFFNHLFNQTQVYANSRMVIEAMRGFQNHELQKQFPFENIYLVDTETGQIVYSVLKKLDFATSLKTGPYAKTCLGQVFEKANQSGRGEVVLVDFAPLPVYKEQTAFLGVPIYDDEQKRGVLILQISLGRINDILNPHPVWPVETFGRTGEVYLVAADGTTRSDLRFFSELPPKLVGLSNTLSPEMKIDNTSVGLPRVETPATRAALSGVTDFDFYEDYHGEVVLSAFAPIAVPGLDWRIFSNRQEAELLESLTELTAKMTQGTVFLALVFLLIGGIAGLLYYLRQIAMPINHLKGVISKVADGYYGVRAELKTEDEFETLANTFNELLDGRIRRLLIKTGYFNCEQLNNSIIELLKATFQLSQCDLAVQIPVGDDITAPLADAINQMAMETGKVLLNMRRISEQMETASYQVKEPGKSLSNISRVEQKVVDITLSELSAEAKATTQIAEVAQSCYEIAHQANRSANTALERVIRTMNGFGHIRETIHETKEQMKRLNERVQDMNHLVTIINTIAEQLASNKTVAVSDVGGGESEVAEGVLQLIEGVLQAITQISSVVKTIQVENNKAIATMGKTIGQVQAGLMVTELQLGEGACEQIKETQKATTKLASRLAQIVESSKQQAQYSDDSRIRAETIKARTQETMTDLKTQMKFTDNLVAYAKNMRELIQVFKLPKNHDSDN